MRLFKTLLKGYKTHCSLIFENLKKGIGLIIAGILQGHGWIQSRFPIRGGNYNDGARAGLAALNMNNRRANTNSNIGFRPALPPSQMSGFHGSLSSAEGKRSNAPSPATGENMNRYGRLVGLQSRIPPMPLFCGGLCPQL